MQACAILKKFIPVFLLFCLKNAAAQTAQPLTTGSIVYADAALETLLPKGTKIEIIGSGFRHTEGPVWLKDSGCLLFSDTKSQTVYRWSAASGISKFLEHAGYTGKLPYGDEPGTNGLALDGKGNLLFCEHGDRRLSAMPLAGKYGKRTVTDNYKGRRYNSPNDLVMSRKDIIYFTDPPFGLPQRNNDPMKESPHGVYSLSPDGNAKLLDSSLLYPNGIAFSPDERRLYVALSSEQTPHIVAYEVADDGSIGKGTIFYNAATLPATMPRGGFDGLKTDKDGNLWATGPGGLLIINKEGKWLGSIRAGQNFANCGWGEDGSVLFITAGAFVYRLKTATRGAGW